ncbi:MAG TPA: sensor histidine kinase [Flavipsychrobacter sp.]|nr:sensor histidine kinase [Flavipsychrobacter sp.]
MNSQHLVGAFIAGTLVLTLFGFFLAIYLIIQKSKQNRFALEKQKIKFDYVNQILRTELEVSENTMNQISQEIHDNVGQVLFLAEMNTSVLATVVRDEKATLLLADTGKLVRQAMSDLRSISHSLSSEQVKQTGLVEALKASLSQVQKAKEIKCLFQVSGDHLDISPERELIIFRIAQEAISNILKHAEASAIDLLLEYKTGCLLMTLKDNGKGFEMAEGDKKKGIGFINMQQRTKVLNGTLKIESAPGDGCKLTLLVNA